MLSSVASAGTASKRQRHFSIYFGASCMNIINLKHERTTLEASTYCSMMMCHRYEANYRCAVPKRILPLTPLRPAVYGKPQTLQVSFRENCSLASLFSHFVSLVCSSPTATAVSHTFKEEPAEDGRFSEDAGCADLPLETLNVEMEVDTRIFQPAGNCAKRTLRRTMPDILCA